MADNRSLQTRCAEMIAVFGEEWQLTPEQQHAYTQAIIAYLPPSCTEAQLQQIIRCYHLDHTKVYVLRNSQHPGFQDAWSEWSVQVHRILRSANIQQSDVTLELEDLAQIALEELRRSISGYRFNSRLSTWAYTVVVRGALRAIRKQRAIKRTGDLVSLDSMPTVDYPASQSTEPEVTSSARELNELINDVLREHGGERWVEIFHLWAHNDQRLVDIGRRLGISTSWVSVLLEQMRVILREHPALLEWYNHSQDAISSPENKHSESETTREKGLE